MKQTLVLKGIGVFASLMSVYHWIAAEAESTDVMFLMIITILIILMDVEKEAIKNSKASLGPQELEKKSLFLVKPNFV
jgi:hypothetical protein